MLCRCSSVMRNSQEMVRASLLPLFNNIAEDLNQTVRNLEQNRFSNMKGTLQRGTTSLIYLHMVLLPVVYSMLDHLGKNNYGVDVFGALSSIRMSLRMSPVQKMNCNWLDTRSFSRSG